MINNVVFDLGGVLIDWNPRYVLKDYFETDEALTYFLNTVCTSEWNEQQDAGRSLEEGTQILLNTHPQYETEIRAYYGRWEEMLGGAIDETVELLSQVIQKDKYRVVALTNWSAETFPIAQSRFEFLSWFESILVSGEENMKKPDPRIYKLLLDRYNLTAEESLFIDDNPHNIQAASNLSFDTILFNNPNQLKDDLNRKKIL